MTTQTRGTGIKKKAGALAAVAVAAALALGGTFAWQGYQSALNEASDVVNPGGRLHDDFDGSNKDVYVENFADDPIFARVKVGEYLEVVSNHGVEGAETSTTLLGGKEVVTDEEGDETTAYSYAPFKGWDSDGDVSAAVDADGASWWTWSTGGDTVYMPTFDKNKDSMEADLNGTYAYAVGEISERDGSQYDGYVDYSLPENATKTDVAVYDADANDVDDDGVKEVEETHAAKSTDYGELMSMAEWRAAGSQAGPYWVYDADGWVYWAQPIEGGSATGLLLDSVEPAQVMDDSWYYAIDVQAQFVTADDAGHADGTGFYADGQRPSSDAEALLRAIGVNMPAPDMSVSSDDDIELVDPANKTETADMGNGLMITYVRVSDPIPVEELRSSYWIASTVTFADGSEMKQETFLGDESLRKEVGADGTVSAYVVGGAVLVASEVPDFSLLVDPGTNTSLTFPTPGVYIPHIGPAELLGDMMPDFGEVTSIEFELLDPDPAEVRRVYSVDEGLEAVLTWDGDLTLSGSGDMPAYTDDDPDPWANEYNSVKSVVIEDGITSISSYAFEGMYELESLKIPSSVKSIGERAFHNCDSLESLTFEGPIDYIGQYAFYSCGSMKQLVFEKSVGHLDEFAFYDCDSLESVRFEDDLTTLGGYAFYDCGSLNSIVFKGDVERVGNHAFDECVALELLRFSGSVGTVGNYVIDGCGSLKSVSFGGDVEMVSGWAFHGCDVLESLEFQGNLVKIDGWAFSGCKTLESVTIAGNLHEIGNYAFDECPALRSLYIPVSLTSIGGYAFNTGSDIVISYEGTEEQWEELVGDSALASVSTTIAIKYEVAREG